MGRVYESNGPDVKVRGTAQHVADKYMQLARDAQSSGDRVMAESYFQYAEHYLRLLAAAQSYPNQTGSPQQQQQRRFGGDDGYDDGDEYSDDDQQTTAAEPARPAASGNGDAEAQPAASAPQSGEAREAGDDGEQPWGGPEPEFLRRGSANGTTRSRRPRSSRQGTRAKSSEDSQPSGENAAAEDTTEQA